MKTLAVCALVITGVLSTAFANEATGGIQWYDWVPAPFAKARNQNKLIMVNVGHEGCSACQMMEERTFSHRKVIQLANDHFVSIQVDSEARPDIGERYSDWAWPATAFMLPDGTQVLAIRGSQRPENFIPILQRMIDGYANGTLEADDLAPYGAPEKPRRTALSEIRDQVRGQLDRGFDDELGGWGKAKALEWGEPTLQLLLRGHLAEDSKALERGIKTLDGFAQQLDPVWGGMYYASFGGWSNVVGEKRMESQASTLQMFAAGYHLTRNPAYLAALNSVDRYLREWMRSSSGTFYANHRSEVPELPADMSMRDYYRLDDQDRRAIGVPTIDHAVYTDINARIILGYVRAFEATRNSAFLDTAETAARTLIAERQTESGWMLQLVEGEALAGDKRVHVLPKDSVPTLRPQAHFGLATLALYQATADPDWLKTTGQLVATMRATLEDPELGGFYGAPADGTEAIVGRRKPLEDNGAAAQLLYLYGVLVKNDDHKDAAQRAIRASAARSIVRREGRITGNLALALELLNAGYVEFSVVGAPDSADAQALYSAGLDVFEPRKVLHYEQPGRYPARDRPAMYICNDDACSPPITNPQNVAVHANNFRPALFNTQVADR